MTTRLYDITLDMSEGEVKIKEWHNKLALIVDGIYDELEAIERGDYGMCGDVLCYYYRMRDAATLIRQAIFGIRREIDDSDSEWE